MKCESLEEVRGNIDRIDEEIIKLIAERSTYVAEAARFKKNSDEVKAPQRLEEVINKVRNLAMDNNVNPDIIEKVYRELIDCFINFELAEHNRRIDKKEEF